MLQRNKKGSHSKEGTRAGATAGSGVRVPHSEEPLIYGLPQNSVAKLQLNEEQAKGLVNKFRNVKQMAKNTRFRFIGEQGAANIDKAENATRMRDNLDVAHENHKPESFSRFLLGF